MAIDKEALRQELLQEMQTLMTPLDIQALRAERILANQKGPWYEVIDMARLSEHAQKRISEIQSSSSGQKPPTVKFIKVTKELQRLYKRLKDGKE